MSENPSGSDHDHIQDPDPYDCPYEEEGPYEDPGGDEHGYHTGPLDQPHLSTTPEEITSEPDPVDDEEAFPMWRVIGAVSVAVVLTAGVAIALLVATGRTGPVEPDPADAGPITQSVYSEPSTPGISEPPTPVTTTPEVFVRTDTPEETAPSTPGSTTRTRSATEPTTPRDAGPPSARQATVWAKEATGLSPGQPFSAAPEDTWMHAITGVVVEGRTLVVEMDADASIDVPAGTAASDYLSAVLAQSAPGSWESAVTEVAVYDRSGTVMVTAPVTRG